MPVSVDRIKKKALKGMDEFTVSSSSNNILDEPVRDDARALLEFCSSFGLVSSIGDDKINLFR